MTHTDIDKQLGCWKVKVQPVLYTDTVKGEQTLRDDLWAISTEQLNYLHSLIDQAKAEQRETDARIAEKGIVRLTNPSQPLVFNELTIYACKLAGNVACEDISKQIRSGDEARKGEK